jgi:hypothetical protein
VRSILLPLESDTEANTCRYDRYLDVWVDESIGRKHEVVTGGGGVRGCHAGLHGG